MTPRTIAAYLRDLSNRIDAALARAAETTEQRIHRERLELLYLHGLGPEWEDTLHDLCGAYPIAEADAAQALTLTLACDRDPAELIRRAEAGEDPLEVARAWQRLAPT